MCERKSFCIPRVPSNCLAIRMPKYDPTLIAFIITVNVLAAALANRAKFQ